MADITSNLIARLPCDEGTGTNAADASGNSHPGTLTGSLVSNPHGAIWTTGKFGSAVALDGITGYIDWSNSSALNTAALSMAGWFYFTALTPAYTAIFSRNSGGYIQLFVKSNGTLAYYDSIGTPYDGTGATTLVINTWYHIGFAYDSVSGLDTYVNGSVDKHVAAAGTYPSISAVTSVGTDLVNAGRYMAGRVDEIRAYSRKLATADFLALANAGSLTRRRKAIMGAA